MAITVTHTTVATGTDAGNGEIHKAEWNEAHTISGLGTGVETFLTTPSSANLAAALTDETGTGTVLFSSQIDNTAYASSWNASTKAPTQDAVYDKFEGYLHPGYIAANFYTLAPPPGATVNGSAAIASNTIYYQPFILTRTITVSDLGARVITTSAGNNFAVAIYAHNATTGKPTGTPLAATGNLSTTSAAAVTGDIAGADVTLTPGIFWAAIWGDNSVATFTMGSSNYHGLASALAGDATAANVVGNGQTLSAYSSSEAYNASAWPDAAGESFTAILSSRGYVIIAKAV